MTTPGDGTLHGFLLGRVSSLNSSPGVAITFATGINNNGQISGTTYADGTHVGVTGTH